MAIKDQSKRSTMLTVQDNLGPEQEKYYANSTFQYRARERKSTMITVHDNRGP